MTSKVFKDAEAALFDMKDGVSVMSGGFGLCGIPENSILEIRRRKLKSLHGISNNIGNSGRGLARLLKEKQISRATCSYVGGNPDLEEQMLANEVEVTLVPQGTFSERIRAAGMGIRGFYIVGHRAVNLTIEEAWRIINESQKGLSGIEAHAKLSITHYIGKTEVCAVTDEPMDVPHGENGVLVFKLYRRAADAKYRGKIAIVGRNPEAIWFNDYEDRIIFDEAGLFTGGAGKPVY